VAGPEGVGASAEIWEQIAFNHLHRAVYGVASWRPTLSMSSWRAASSTSAWCAATAVTSSPGVTEQGRSGTRLVGGVVASAVVEAASRRSERLA
jgi:hypothetical protein